MSYLSSPWIVAHRSNPHAQLRIICFHYAGGSASAFRTWADKLPPDVELLAIQLPGRESRFGDDAITDFDTLVKTLVVELQCLLDKPFVVFGHSLGTLVGFEWLRGLARKHMPSPELFIAAGRRAPQFPDNDGPISFLPEEEFVKALLKDYASKLAHVLEKKELREVFMPQLRADFALSETYKFTALPKLRCPIYALAGVDEPKLSDQELAGWSQQTEATFESDKVPGDHFFLHSSEHELLDLINKKLLGVLRMLNMRESIEA